MPGPDDVRVRPAYTTAQAARYIGVKSSTYGAWVRGYVKRFQDRPEVRRGPLIHAVPAPPGHPTVSFVGLTESLVVNAFRRAGLPMQRIRPAVKILQGELGLEHVLASRRLYTDGAEVLFEYASRYDDDELGVLTVVRSGQTVFHEVIRDYLRRLAFDKDEWASRLELPITDGATLMVDPERAFGLPLFVHGGAPLDSVVSRLKAGEDRASVAADFAVPEGEVRAVERVLIEA